MAASSILDRRQLLRTGVGLGALALAGPAWAQAAPRRGGVLRISVDQAAAKLNPLLTRVNPEYLLAELLYSGLTRLGTDMTPEPDLAESWTISPDGLMWRPYAWKTPRAVQPPPPPIVLPH